MPLWQYLMQFNCFGFFGVAMNIEQRGNSQPCALVGASFSERLDLAVGPPFGKLCCRQSALQFAHRAPEG